ncbi:MAG: hypothetical protein GWP42_09230, partial [Verrucomicrobiales bacterium]|nr:hypothetical protein [Verrucomicrobiales bacterium]
MSNTVDSSPLQRLGIFLLGLIAFAAFGLVAWIGFKVSGADNDSNYAKQSQDRIAKVMASDKAQEGAVIPNNSDLEKFANTFLDQKAKVTKKPVPGTEAFNEWMKEQAAKQAANTPKAEEPKEEKPKEEAAVKLTLKAVGNPPGTMKFENADISVKAGSKVILTFENPDVLQHNFVLTKIGKKDAVGALADAMVTEPGSLCILYVSESDDVLGGADLGSRTLFEVIVFFLSDEAG